MIFSTMFSIQMLAVVQTQTPAHLIGKVIACIMAFIMCAQPAGQMLYGILFEKMSKGTPLLCPFIYCWNRRCFLSYRAVCKKYSKGIRRKWVQ